MAEVKEKVETGIAIMKPEIKVDGKEAVITYPDEQFMENCSDPAATKKALKEMRSYNEAVVAAVAKEAKTLFGKHKDLEEITYKAPASPYKDDRLTGRVKKEVTYTSPASGEKIKKPNVSCVVKTHVQPGKAYMKRVTNELHEALENL